MQLSAIPTKMPVLWASTPVSGTSRVVPIPSQVGLQSGAASFTTGFPQYCFTAGGWPFGQDFNGLLNAVTAWNQWQQAGGPVNYDGAFATNSAVNGYPKGAVLAAVATTPGNFWLNLVDNNTSNPDTGGANWVGFSVGIPTAQLFTGTDTSGAANAIVCPNAGTSGAITPSVPSPLLNNMLFQIGVANPNTLSAVTFTPNTTIGALNMFRADGTALVPGDIQGPPYKALIAYDANTNKALLQNPCLWDSAGSVPFPGLPINGLLPSSMAGSLTTASMSVSSGGCSNNTGQQSTLSSLSINWSVANGNAINGYQGGASLPANTTLFMFLVWGSAGIGLFASLSSTAPVVPAGYPNFRMIFPFYTNGSGPVPFNSYEGQGGSIVCRLSTTATDLNGFTIPTSARALVPLSVPLGVPVEWTGKLYLTSSASISDVFVIVTSAGDPDLAPSPSVAPLADGAVSAGGSLSFYTRGVIVTNTSGQIGIRATVNASIATAVLSTIGWIYYRRL